MSELSASWMTTRLPCDADGVYWCYGRKPRGFVQRVGHEEWPSVEPLARADDLVGALNLLNGPSRTPDHATDHRRARDWIADPLWSREPRPAGDPRWDLTLVVDAGRSMSIWDTAAAELVASLRRWRAFRVIEVLELDSDVLEPERLVPRQPSDPLMAPDARPPVDASCQMVLVLTDGLGAAWASGAMRPLLHQWGLRSAIAIVHLLPERLWSITGIRPFGTRLRAHAPNSPAASTDWVKVPESDLAPRGAESPADDGDFPVPVLELDVRWLRTWAGFLARSPSWSHLQVLLAGPQRTSENGASGVRIDGRTPTAANLVYDFRRSASPMTFALATHLAAAPLNIPVMRLVQGVLQPLSRPFHLSEILAGGLLRPVVSRAELLAHDRITFEFPAGVREELLAESRRTQTVNVVRLVAEYLGRHVPCVRMFGEVLEDPTGDQVPELTPEMVPYARVYRAVLDALSGQHRARAQRIRAALSGYGG